MKEPENVAQRVVVILLAIAVECVPVGWKWVVHSGHVVGGRLRLTMSAGVFAAVRADQAIGRVVNIFVGRRNNMVLEIDGLLRVVANRGDVADRIERVVQILKAGFILLPPVSSRIMRKVNGS